MEIPDGTKKKMAIKAHTDLMEKGQALLDDPNFDIRLKVLVSEEMENSRKCMEGFVRTPENNLKKFFTTFFQALHLTTKAGKASRNGVKPHNEGG